MRCIIVDTSSILFGFMHHTDVFARINEELPGSTILISKGIMNELEGLSKSRRQSAYAKAALASIEKRKPEVSESTMHVDSWIIYESARRKCGVCTNDTALRERLRRKGISVMSLSMGGRLR